MKIRRIGFNNFRQFYGQQSLDLAVWDDRNVTLVHAENGVGKTTILNAIYWSLFGQVTSRFEQPDQLVNFEAEAEGVRATSVDVSFEFDGLEYRALRRRGTTASDHFTVSAIESGAMRPLPGPESFLGSVIPREMAAHFFFDGEHAETFSGAANRDVGTAIRNMLGCDLAERASKDLQQAAQAYTKQIGAGTGDAEAQAMQTVLERLRADQDRDELAMADHRRTVEALRDQKAAIEEELRATAASREIQVERDRLQARLAEVVRSLSAAEAEVVRWVGSRAVAVICRRLARETLGFIDEEALRGRIPSPYNELFIRGLLHDELCICHRPLEPMGEHWNNVAELLKKAGNAEALNRAVRARSRLQTLRDAAADAPKLLTAAQGQAARFLEERRTLEQQIGEQDRRLQDFSIDEVREREDARLRIERRIETLSREVGSLDTTMTMRGREIAAQIADIERFAQRSARARALVARSRLATRAAAILQDRLSAYEVEARRSIEGDINGILERVARRDYRFRFDDDFGMSLLYAGQDRTVPRSGGENQLLSLAFTAALVRFARSRIGAANTVLAPGTVAPLVLDAPFGQLDVHYKASTAAFVPEMAGQVLLLLSSSHASPEVLAALRPRIGAEYVLISDNRGVRGGRSDDAIDIGGRAIIRSRYNQDRSQTVIERVA